MALFSTHAELDDLGGGRFRQTQYLRRIAYYLNGNLRRCSHLWADGDVNFPNVVTDAALMVYTANDGMRRICPTRDPARYVEIGAPYVKPAATWNKVNLGTPTRSGNTLTWTTAQAKVNVVMAGHYIDLNCEFLGGWRPPNSQIAFPVGMNGLTRNGMVFYQDGTPVLTLRPMVVYDAANTIDVRPVTTQLVQVSGQWYALATLPSLTGMTRPVLDPQLALQPDGTDGKDTYISSAQADTNFGAGETMLSGYWSGSRRTLIQFNLSTIPSTATVTAATLSLWIAAARQGYFDRDFQLRRLKRNWVEAEATWNIFSTGNNWATAGATHADDLDGTVVATTTIGDPAVGAQYDWAITPSTVKALVDGTMSNYGWLLTNPVESDDTQTFDSSDSATAGERPKLVVDYTVPSGRHGARMIHQPDLGYRRIYGG